MNELTPDTRQDSARMRAVLVLTAAIAFASAPFWSSGFGGFDPNDFPVPLDDPATQPAGYVFSIWGIIYLWLLASAGYGLLARAEDPAWDAGRWWLIASLAMGAPWISVAVISPVWATVLILAMLGAALRALWLTPETDRSWLRLPLALYAGWLTAASGVSASVLLAGYGAPQLVSIAALFGALVLGLIVQLRLGGAPTYGIAIAWGLSGVVVKNFSQDGFVVGSLAFFAALAMLGASLHSHATRSG